MQKLIRRARFRRRPGAGGANMCRNKRRKCRMSALLANRVTCDRLYRPGNGGAPYSVRGIRGGSAQKRCLFYACTIAEIFILVFESARKVGALELGLSLRYKKDDLFF